jgi:ABC-2 type transport system permease protein
MSLAARLRHSVRAYPTLFRIGFAGMVAYRAEFLVWILTTNMPLVMMALWNAVAADGPVGRFGQQELNTYYLAVLVVRILTSSWMVWELTMDIRHGRLATRLLRPLHPLLAYSAEHLAAVPMRALVVAPLVGILVWVMDFQLPLADPVRLGIFVLSLIGAWFLLFFTMVLIGSLAMFVDSALSVFEIWLGIHFVLSGYLVPIELLPSWAVKLSHALPFWFTLGFPVETAVGLLDVPTALRALAIQWLYLAGMALAAMLVWRRGMRRFVAFGG